LRDDYFINSYGIEQMTMGSISDALKKAKTSPSDRSSKDASTGADATNTNSSVKTLGPGEIHRQPVFEELSKLASRYELDPDILQKNRVTSDQQALAVRAAYKMLRTRLLQRLRANNWTTLAISSARSNAGKTLTAINTSISLAHELNQHVILVDLDLRRPSIARYLGIEPRYGISDYLLNDVPIEKIVVRPNIDRLLIIPNNIPQEYSSELLSSAKMKSLMQRLSNDLGGCLVIIDLPPMLDADDMLAFSPQVDALLFVVAECETRRADLLQASDILEDLEVIGIILNKSDDESPTYY
jgi:Mrp family chromosome partitioning ATPase